MPLDTAELLELTGDAAAIFDEAKAALDDGKLSVDEVLGLIESLAALARKAVAEVKD